MATAATSLLGLALPVTGELSGTWGDAVNVSITALLDTAVAGTTTLSADADVTLTTTTLAANQARQAIILWTAGGTATRTITVPAQSKSYIVINKTSSSQSIKIVGAGPTTGVTIVAGTAALVVWNGVDFVTASVTSTTGVLPVANGGTGLTAGTSGGVLAYTAAGTLASSTALAANALVIGGGAGAAPSTTTTGTGVLTFLGTPSSANLAAAVTDETGTGALVFATSPTFVTPALGTPASGTVTNLTGTASININGTVGATTASTGAFTTLTTSSTVTVNGGTANGVAFLDASKVLTTGSALTFDAFGQFCVGGSANAAKFGVTDGTSRLNINASSSTATISAHNAAVTAFLPLITDGSFTQFNVIGTETMRLTTTGLKSSIAGTNADPVFSYTADTNTGIFFPAADKLGFTAGGGTDQMVLTSTGLGIGTSSPQSRLEVRQDQAGAITRVIANNNNATSGSGSSFDYYFGTTRLGGLTHTFAASAFLGFDVWSGSAATERARISADGTFRVKGAGTAGSTDAFQVAGGAPADAARIDSSGNLLVGTASAVGRFTSETNSSSQRVVHAGSLDTSATTDGIYYAYCNTVSGTGFNFAQYQNASATVYKVVGNGNVQNANNSYGAISDAKLKENVTDATPKLEKLQQVRVVNYNLIGQEQKQLGVIAQELEQIFPGMVDESPDRDKKGNDLGTTTKSVKYSVFVPMLIKAIQEQQALITALTARITALESSTLQ